MTSRELPELPPQLVPCCRIRTHHWLPCNAMPSCVIAVQSTLKFFHICCGRLASTLYERRVRSRIEYIQIRTRV